MMESEDFEAPVETEELPIEVQSRILRELNVARLQALHKKQQTLKFQIPLPSYDTWWHRMMLEHLIGDELPALRHKYEIEVSESLTNIEENVVKAEAKIAEMERIQRLSAPRAMPPKLFQEPPRNNRKR
jgi:hypothetical protein